MAAAKPAKKAASDETDPKEDGATSPDGVELPKKKISGKKMALILVVLILVLGAGAGAGLYFTGIIGGKHGEAGKEGAEGHEGGKDGKEGEATGPVFFEMPQILVNLQSSGRRPSFLRLKVSLQLKKEEDKAAVTTALPRVTDSFQLYLRELSKEELQGTAGLERLREELRLRVAAALSPVEVKDVLFTEMIFGD